MRAELLQPFRFRAPLIDGVVWLQQDLERLCLIFLRGVEISRAHDLLACPITPADDAIEEAVHVDIVPVPCGYEDKVLHVGQQPRF